MTEYEKKIEELKLKMEKNKIELRQALLDRDIERHQEFLSELIKLDAEFTKLLGGIQCPVK